MRVVARHFIPEQLQDETGYVHFTVKKLAFEVMEKMLQEGYIQVTRRGREIVVHHGFPSSYWDLVMCQRCEKVIHFEKAAEIDCGKWICQECNNRV